MTKQEFLKNVHTLGYAPKKEAEEYCEGRDEFTEDDYIEVYRKAHEKLKFHNTGRYGSKVFFTDGGEEGNR